MRQSQERRALRQFIFSTGKSAGVIYIFFLFSLPLVLFFQGGDFCLFEMVINTIERVLSLMDKIPLSIEGAGGGSSGISQLPDLNLPAPEEVEDLTLTPVEREIIQKQREIIESQKKELAELIEPLIEKEVQRFPSLRKIPSSLDVLETIILRIGSPFFKKMNDKTVRFEDFRAMKMWITRAKKNVGDEFRGEMNIRAELSRIIEEWGRGE